MSKYSPLYRLYIACILFFVTTSAYSDIEKGVIAGALGESNLIHKTVNGYFKKTDLPLSNEQLSKQHFKTAIKHLSNAEMDKAENNLSLAISYSKNNVKARELLATILVKSDRYKKAISLLMDKKTYYSIPTSSVMLAANIYARENLIKQAVLTLESSRPNEKLKYKYYAMLAAMYYKSASYSKAKNIYQNLLKQNPKNSILWLGLGVSLEASSNKLAAVKAYKQVIKNGLNQKQLLLFVNNKINELSAVVDVLDDQAS